jgi:pilus assembly protein CpaF
MSRTWPVGVSGGKKSDVEDLKRRIHNKLVERIDLDRVGDVEQEALRREVRGIVENLCDAENTLLNRGERAKLIDEVLNEIFGLGPLEDLLHDPDTTDIMINGPKSVYVDHHGEMEKTSIVFRDGSHLMQVIDRIVSRVGRRLDMSSPLVDARLPDGSRVNAIIAPLAVNGPYVSIRRFPLKRLTIDDLIRLGAITRSAAMFLGACVVDRRNIIVSGGTSTGKTTMLNILSRFIPLSERVITVEDTAELQLYQDNLVTLETKPPNIEGIGEYSMGDLVRNALRMRPDRIVVGECRGREVLDMVQAMTTGHDGSMTTLHANSSREVIERLEILMLMAAELPITAIHRQIAAALDLIVHISHLAGGRRAVTEISELLFDSETKDIVVNPIYASRSDEVLRPTAYRPTFLEHLVEKKLLDIDLVFGTASETPGAPPSASEAPLLGSP